MSAKNMKKTSPFLMVVLLVLVFVGLQSAFIVDEREQVLVLQFGNPVNVIQEPGLKFKIPFIQNLVVIDRRILEVDPDPEELLLRDQKRFVVDTFLRYKIADPLLFYQTLKTEMSARSRLKEQVNSSLRSNLGKATLQEVLSEKRAQLMVNIAEEVNNDVERLGLSVIDVRIVRADLPEETSKAIYDRMVSERQREAAEARAQGQELAQQIRAKADKEKTILLAEAENKAQVMRGQGDGKAIEIYASAFNKDPKFYAFYRSLEAYRKGLNGDNTTFVLTPDSEFFEFFNDLR